MPDTFRRLPWLAALVAFLVYAGTMGAGVTVDSLPLVSKLCGWDPLPMVGQPVVWLVTLPLKIFPSAWVPLLLKLLAATVAAAVLGLLARMLQLLPWDHPWSTAGRFAFLIPVAMAMAICGLEFGFWQAATAALPELIDLLLLAVAGWLLFEYKLRQNSRWLDAAAVVWGAGMAQNWVMLLMLPVFIAALIWLQRLQFFQVKFILRMVVLGLAGFSIYAVLPMVNGLAPGSPWDLDKAWHESLHYSKNIFLLIYYGFWRGHRLLMFAVLIYFLVPTLPLLVRKRDEDTQDKLGVDRFQIWLYRCLRIGVLLACVWLAFDPKVGPQELVQHQLGVRLPMLTLDYVNALGAAFLIGNLLLISQIAGERWRPPGGIPWRQVALPAASAGVALVSVALLARNSGAVVRQNFHPLEQIGEEAVKCLPSGGGIVLCDFPQRLEVFQAAMAHRPDAAKWLAVDSHALPKMDYRAQLERQLPVGWLTDQSRHDLTPLETTWLLAQIARTNHLFYLHPSYGQFFEAFYLVPSGLVYEMKSRGKDPLVVPPLAAAELDANEKYWTRLWDSDLARLAPPPAHRQGGWEKRIQQLGITTSASVLQDRLLGEWYSMALDAWGVTLQKQGRLREASERLEEALRLNPNNLSARISRACNTNLQKGTAMGLADVARVAEQLGNASRIHMLLNNGGPLDEPTIGYVLGTVFLDSGLLLQSAEQFERVRALTPGSLAPEFALAEIYNRLQMPDRGRPLIAHLREESKKLPANSSLDLNLALLDSYSSLLQTNSSQARNALETVVEQHPDDMQVKNRVLAAYLAFKDFTNALQLVDGQLAKSPGDVVTLNTKAAILVQAGRTAEAIPILNQVLMVTNFPAARLNRAFALLSRQNYGAAESDFHILEKSGGNLGAVDFGLAAVAQNRGETNQAAQYLRLCISNTPAGTPLWRQASARLQNIEAAAK